VHFCVQNKHKTGQTVNKLSQKKLLNSKWTAVSPIKKEKHFTIVKVEVNEDQIVIGCILQAIMSKRDIDIVWRDLRDEKKWIQGWE